MAMMMLGAEAYQGAAVGRPALSSVSMTAIKAGDIGTTKPLGVYDPLGLMTSMPDKYIRWQGYLSYAEDIKFSDMPGGAIASWAALPNLAWAQIVLVVALLDNSVLAQDPAKAPGDVGDGTFVQPGKIWVRYDDTPGFSGKEFKLNAERNNGRAAMMGIAGMTIHEALTGNPVS